MAYDLNYGGSGGDAGARAAGYGDFADYQNKMAQSSAGGTSGSYDDVLKSLPSSVDFAKGLNSMQNNAFDDYFKTAQGQAKPLDVYNQLEGQAGIPTLRKTQATLSGQVNNLEDAIRGVERNINTGTNNSLVTEGQRQGMINSARYPMQQQLTPLATSLSRVGDQIGNAEQGINNKVGYAVEGNQQELDPYKMKINLAGDQAARMMTGFSADKQSTLDVLLAKMHRGEQLSDMEKQHLWDLSNAETSFEHQKTLIQSNPYYAYRPMGRYGAIDTATGQVINGGGGGNASPGINLGNNTNPNPNDPLNSFWGTT